MITLAASGTLQGKAGTATAVTYTVSGDSLASNVDAFQILGQGQLGTGAAAMVTAGGSAQVLIKSILLANATASPVANVILYVNGTAAANQIVTLNLPANGSAVYSASGWVVYDSNGAVQTTVAITLTGDVTGSGNSPVTTTLATVNANTGSWGDASHVAQVTLDGKGRATSAASVAIAIANTAVSGLGTASTKNTGNTVLDPGTGALEIAAPITATVGASKTYVATDRGKYYQRSNTGSAMTDTMPSPVTMGNGYSLIVSNVDTVLAATITFTTPVGLFPNGTTTYVLNYARRQTFTSDGTNWQFVGSGNANLVKIPATAVASGDFIEFTDSAGATTNRTPTQVKTDLGLAAIASSGSATDLTTGTLPAGRFPALTGDVTTVAGALPTTLKNTGPGATGPTGSATTVPVVTIDAQGRTTALTSAAIQITESQVTSLTTDLGAKAVSSRLLNTTAPLTGGGDLTADRTLAISAASTSAAGSMSAADKVTVNDLWYDVTNYGVTTSNSGATNTANMNTLIQTTAPTGARFFFPQTGANYPFNGAIVVTKNSQTFCGTGDFNSVLFQNSTTDDLFRLGDGINKPTFMDLGMWMTVTGVSGSAINCGTVGGSGVPQLSVYRCGFQTFGGSWFNCILLNGSRSGEVMTVQDCVMNGFTNYGIGQIGNTSTPSTTSALYVANTTMNGGITGTTGAVAGIFVQQSGALQLDNVDIISCANNLLVAPITSVNQVAASIYAVNCYFDHSHGSCVKLAGTQPIVRCKFTACSMTVCNDAGANYSAFEVNNSAANPPGDIDLLACSFQNTFNNTATTNGILISTAMNIKIIGNNINGWTNGIQITPSAAGVTRVQIIGNTIGPGTISASASATGILLNAGSAAYGMLQIVGNTFPATNAYQNVNTAQITDNSTIGTATAQTGQRIIQANSGQIMTAPNANYAATVIPLTTVTNVDSRGGLYFPLGLRPCSGRITVYASNAATVQTLTPKIVFGPLNTSADPVLMTLAAFTAGTAVLGAGLFTIDWELTTATLMFASLQYHNLNNAATGITATAAPFQLIQGTPAPGITVSTAAQNNWLGVYFSSATASAITIRSVKYEVQSQ